MNSSDDQTAGTPREEDQGSSVDWGRALPHSGAKYVQAEKIVYIDTAIVSGDINALTADPERSATTGPAATPAPKQAVPEDIAAEVARVLAAAGPPRAPVVIAVETTADPLTDADLLRTQRHLTVSMTPAQVDRCEALAASVRSVTSLAGVIETGRQLWFYLTQAQPRLDALLQRVGDAAPAQPVAWAGRPDLLARLHRTLMLAHTGRGGVDDFVSVGYGGHYLFPVHGRAARRSMRGKSEEPPQVAVIELGSQVTGPDGQQVPDRQTADPLGAVAHAAAPAGVVMAIGVPEIPVDLPSLASVLEAEPRGRTRAVLAFGCSPLNAEGLDDILSGLPFVSVADAGMAEPLVRDALAVVVQRHARTYAMPCIVAAVRAAWVRRAVAQGLAGAVMNGLTWTSWSWVGLTLFATSYPQPQPAKYPHLGDLRSVAGSGWYFNRRKGIPDEYVGEALAGIDVPPEDRFHLYLSGAGGTGKSCFLKFVYDEIYQRPDCLAVWYRVDAPSSTWDTLQRRIREEILDAVADRFGTDEQARFQSTPGRLAVFLRSAVGELRKTRDPDFQIVIFVDQLERTFESGDDPEPVRLETISSNLLQLLGDVKVGQGVRLFIASRKQYLPDFLRSSRAVQEYGLQFNVLQPITDSNERVEFVQQVVEWSREQQLIEPHVEIHPDAALSLVSQVKGNPLNTMLALIQLLSADLAGPVLVSDLNQHSPWERLFALDLQAARQDDLAWYFLLAMAHARTEIVRFEEVWWRLRMVDPRLTQRVDALRRDGVLERLWFLGFLGRTIHARQAGTDPARYVEFFHANLRDYLLRDIMARGGPDLDAWGGLAGTPAAWRALDRLSVYAHDWGQTQQLLPPEDVRVLMQHRQQVIETHPAPGEGQAAPFQLLFLRDRENAREVLCQAATECFVFSALVHDDLGRWAFQTLVSDLKRRVELCFEWLDRCSVNSRFALLRYLVELDSPVAWDRLVKFVLDESQVRAEEVGHALAQTLAEPLYAARYRNEFLAALLESAPEEGAGPAGEMPLRAVLLVIEACGWDRDAVVQVLAYANDRYGGNQGLRAAWRDVGPSATAEMVDRWLERAGEGAGLRSIAAVERSVAGQAVLGVVVSDELAIAVDAGRLAAWSADLRERLGVPLPALQLVRGESRPDELELRFGGDRIQANVFYPDRACILRRHWESTRMPLPHEAFPVYDAAGEEDVVWLTLPALRRAGYTLPARNFDQAVVDWLEAHCRHAFDRLFDLDMLIQLLRETGASTGRRWRLSGFAIDQLRQVLIELVEEGVPLSPLLPGLNEHLARIVVTSSGPAAVVRALREIVRTEICRSVADESGLVTTIMLDQELEESLANRVRHEGRGGLALGHPAALALAAAVRRQVELVLQGGGLRVPVLVTPPPLRSPLARLLRQFDHRIKVLSWNELDPQEITLAHGGLVRMSPGTEAMT